LTALILIHFSLASAAATCYWWSSYHW